MDVDGSVANGYEAVLDAVGSCGPGVAVAAFVHGEPVVDVWTDGLSEQSLIGTWSAVKPVTGSCLLWLVERGSIGLDDRVTDVWPEIADDRMLVRHVLTHAAGRVTVPAAPMTDWEQSIAALAAQPADWAPGEVLCEHAMTFGHLVGEVVRRVDGRSIRQLFAEELSGPLDLDLHIGVDERELPRVADTVGLDEAWWASVCGDPGSARARSLGARPDVNADEWRLAQIPAVNGYATARGLASFWQAYLDGNLPPYVGEPGAAGVDRFVGEEVTWTLAGGQVDRLDVGMAGLGGQWGAARPSAGLAWAFLTTHMGDMDRLDRVEASLLTCVATAQV